MTAVGNGVDVGEDSDEAPACPSPPVDVFGVVGVVSGVLGGMTAVDNGVGVGGDSDEAACTPACVGGFAASTSTGVSGVPSLTSVSAGVYFRFSQSATAERFNIRKLSYLFVMVNQLTIQRRCICLQRGHHCIVTC
jgi:hypothetical protein